jgi:hypothetical protein
MSTENREPKLPADLWGRYRTAFRDWATEVVLLKDAQSGAPENRALAQDRTNAAEATYRESRERLTDGMAKATGTASSPGSGTESAI